MHLLRLGILALVVIGVTACGDNNTSSGSASGGTSQTDGQLADFYDDHAETTKQEFLKNCDSAGNRAFCDCFIGAIEEEMTYAEYLTDMSGANGSEVEERITEKNDEWTLACMTGQ